MNGFTRNGKFHPIGRKNSGISKDMFEKLSDPERNGTIFEERKYGISAEISVPPIAKFRVWTEKDVVNEQ